MIYTKLTNEAMKIAYKAHHGQFDNSGIPYVFHPFHLAEQMKDEYSTCVALLHDVAEDSSVTLQQLSEIFPQEIISALTLLIHSDGTDYFDYVRAIKNNPMAKAVKLADLRHNSDETRLDGIAINPDKVAFWREKYSKALQILTVD